MIKVDGGLAPIATGNFVALAACGYYNGVVFSRLVPGFRDPGWRRPVRPGRRRRQAVGRDPGPGRLGQPRLYDRRRAGDNDLRPRHRGDGPDRGSAKLAGTSSSSSWNDAAAQSLIQANNYAILGKVTRGMDVVDAIAALPNSGDPDNAALNPVPMTSVTVGP